MELGEMGIMRIMGEMGTLHQTEICCIKTEICYIKTEICYIKPKCAASNQNVADRQPA